MQKIKNITIIIVHILFYYCLLLIIEIILLQIVHIIATIRDKEIIYICLR